jgi:hypothetical protein
MTHLTPVPAVDGPRNPLIPVSWVFTFGLEHPLRKRYVQLTGDEETCRELMRQIFGRGNWAGCYREDVASRVIDRGRLKLLDLGLGGRPDVPKPELIDARTVRDPIVGLIGLLDHSKKYMWSGHGEVEEFIAKLDKIALELASAMPENQHD